MVEQFKTLLLLVLIGLSLFLTYQLWYGQKPAELVADDVYEQVEVEAPRPLEDVIVPGRIVISCEEGAHLYRKGAPGYEKIWDKLSALLQNIDNNFSTDSQNAPPEEAIMCMSANFDPPLPTGIEMPWLSGLSGSGIEGLDLYCLEDSYWLVVSPVDEGKKYLPVGEERVGKLTGVMEELTAGSEPAYGYLGPESVLQEKEEEAEEEATEDNDRDPGYFDPGSVLDELELDIDIVNPIYVPRDERVMKRVSLEAENLDQELLLKTFFVDYNLARVIEERDGGRLYTDGEKGLRLSDLGFEYSYPRLEEGQTAVSYSEALRSSSSLISYHGGWPDNLRLESVGLESRGGKFFYEAEWKIYLNGYPLISGQPTRIMFNDLGLFHFTRFLFKPAGAAEAAADELILGADKEKIIVADWSEALSKAVEELKERSEGFLTRMRLEDMHLSYAVTGSKASPRGTPVWVVKINGEEIILKADKLEVINEEDLI